MTVGFSVYVDILANNTLRTHGGLSANGLLDFFFLIDSSELLEIMFAGRAFHSLAVVGAKLFPNVLGECLM